MYVPRSDHLVEFNDLLWKSYPRDLEEIETRLQQKLISELHLSLVSSVLVFPSYDVWYGVAEEITGVTVPTDQR